MPFIVLQTWLIVSFEMNPHITMTMVDSPFLTLTEDIFHMILLVSPLAVVIIYVARNKRVKAVFWKQRNNSEAMSSTVPD